MDGKRHTNATASGHGRLRAFAVFILLLLFVVQASPALFGSWTRGVHASSSEHASHACLIETADAESEYDRPDGAGTAVVPASPTIARAAADVRPAPMRRLLAAAAPPLGLPQGRAPPLSSQQI